MVVLCGRNVPLILSCLGGSSNLTSTQKNHRASLQSFEKKRFKCMRAFARLWLFLFLGERLESDSLEPQEPQYLALSLARRPRKWETREARVSHLRKDEQQEEDPRARHLFKWRAGWNSRERERVKEPASQFLFVLHYIRLDHLLHARFHSLTSP